MVGKRSLGNGFGFGALVKVSAGELNDEFELFGKKVEGRFIWSVLVSSEMQQMSWKPE
jgi:hypothetical protein